MWAPLRAGLSQGRRCGRATAAPRSAPPRAAIARRRRCFPNLGGSQSRNGEGCPRWGHSETISACPKSEQCSGERSTRGMQFQRCVACARPGTHLARTESIVENQGHDPIRITSLSQRFQDPVGRSRARLPVRSDDLVPEPEYCGGSR